MTRTMFDSTTAGDIPHHATMVGAYIDGKFQTIKQARDRFPHATIVEITVLGTPGAHVIDRETGDVDATHAATWAAGEVKAGRAPTIYCNRSAWPEVKTAVHAAGITGQVHYWIADWTGSSHTIDGAVACQYADPKTSGGHFDLSVVADHWPGVDHGAAQGGSGGHPSGHHGRSPGDEHPVSVLAGAGAGSALAPEALAAVTTLQAQLSRRTEPVAADNGERDLLVGACHQIARVLALT